MEDQPSPKKDRPPSPVLVSPREASVVDGSEVTFVWQPVEGAEAYRVQVATDAAFNSVVYEQEVGEKTALVVTDMFPTTEETFFWRVLAQVDGTWSEGNRVESFLSGAPGEEPASADQEDVSSVGPVTELVRAASRLVSTQPAAETEEGRFEREVERGFAYEEFPIQQVATVVVTLVVIVTLIVVVLFQWTQMTAQTVRGERAAVEEFPVQEEERAAERRLQEFGVISEEDGIYQIPIDQAMDAVADEYAEEEREYSREVPVRPR